MAAFSRGRPFALLFSTPFSTSTRLCRPLTPFLIPLATSQNRSFSISTPHLKSISQKAKEQAQCLAEDLKLRETSRPTRNVRRTQDQTVTAPTTETPIAAPKVSATQESSPVDPIGAQPATQLPRHVTTPFRPRPAFTPTKYVRPPSKSLLASAIKDLESKLAAGKESVIYEEPITGRSTMSLATGLVAVVWGFMLLNLILFVWDLSLLGIKSSVWLTGTYIASGCVIAFITWAGYSARTSLIKKITLMPTKGRSGLSIKARIEARGWAPFMVSTHDAPVSKLRVSNAWSEIEHPKPKYRKPMSEIAWVLKPIYWFKYQLSGIFYCFRWKLSRGHMMRLWAIDTSTGGRRTIWNSYLLDADGLLPPKEEKWKKMYNDSDGMFHLIHCCGHC